MKKQIVTNIKELKKPCIAVEKDEDISQILIDLKDSLDWTKGYALAANQIGYNKKICYIRFPNETGTDDDMYMINPKIVSKADKIVFEESCLSFSGIKIKTDRYTDVVVSFSIDSTLEEKVGAFSNLDAIVVQHEIAHLNGQTLFDFKHKAR